MKRSTRTWIVLSLLGVTAIIGIVELKRGNSVAQEALSRPAVEVRHEQSEPASEIANAASSSFSCAGQRLDIVMDDGVEPVCMGTLITKHNGSVRSYQVASLAAPHRWLRIEVAGSTILSAAWGSQLRPDFQCRAVGCEGITISRRDAQGVRVMKLEHTSLMRGPESVQLSGRFEVPSEQLACADQGVSIVTSDASSQTFCPRGGAGFELSDDGTKRYRFTSLDGESIVVATDQDQQVKRVQYEGEISLACQSVECGSVRISVADAEGARRFTFSGATLIEIESGQSNAVLNGSLILPPL